MKKILLALFAFISFSCPAFASDWIYVNKFQSGETVYLDRDSVMKSYGNITSWTKTVVADGSVLLVKFSFRESDRSFSTIAFALYDAKGKLVKEYTVDQPQYSAILPDSMAESIFYYSFMTPNRVKTA